jgi:hypothetical protein
MSRSARSDDLQPAGKRLLGELLDVIVSAGRSPPALKFRAKNYGDVAVLDQLETHGILRRVDNGYAIDVIALPSIGTEAACVLLQRMESLYAALRQRYKASQDAPVAVAQLAGQVQLTLEQAVQALRMMGDVSLWNRGRSSDLSALDAYVLPSEALLKYASFDAMLREVASWSALGPRTAPAIAGGPASQHQAADTGSADHPIEVPAALAEALLGLVSELDSLQFSLNGYYDDRESQGVIDRLVGGKIKALLAHCDVFGWAELGQRLRELLPVDGSAAEAMDMVRSFVVPQIRRLVMHGSEPVALPKGEIVLAWPAVRACLQEFRFDEIKAIAGLAGLDLTAVAHLVQMSEAGATKGRLLSAIDGQFGEMPAVARNRFLTILIEEILRRRPEAEEKLSEYLSRLGWSFAGQTLVPLDILDPDALEWTPRECRRDLLKAAQRFRDGDLSGAISAACGAVDAATSTVYEQLGLGDPTQDSFQQRCRRAAQAKGVLPGLQQQLQNLGWGQEEIAPFQKNLEGALNQGAYVLQTLRSHMGDVHGSKPILGPLVFDCLRWAELLSASLTSERPGAGL